MMRDAISPEVFCAVKCFVQVKKMNLLKYLVNQIFFNNRSYSFNYIYNYNYNRPGYVSISFSISFSGDLALFPALASLLVTVLLLLEASERSLHFI